MRIRGFEKISCIQNFVLQKRRNAHSTCCFKAAVTSEVGCEYLEQVGKLLYVEQDTGEPIFVGRIQKVNLEQTFHTYFLEVEAASLSMDLDLESHTRIFQDPDKKLGDVLSSTRLKINHCELRLAENVKTKPYPQLLIQNQESNFSFIRRIADYAGISLWIKDTLSDRVEIKVADCLEPSENLVEDKDVISCQLSKEIKGRKAFVRLNRYLELGRLVKIGRGSICYVVAALCVKRVHGTDEFSYELEEFPTRSSENKPVYLEKSMKFKAKVCNVQDPKNMGAIQVQFIDEYLEDLDQEKRAWLPYRSPYSGKAGGIVFLPDPDDVVEVLFANGECWVGSTVRTEPLSKECSKVKEKYIGNNTDQRIFWREQALEILSFKNRILMDKDKIELSVGSNKIIIDEKQILLTGEQIVLQTKENQIFLSGDMQIQSQGKINLKGNGVLSLAGSKVNIC